MESARPRSDARPPEPKRPARARPLPLSVAALAPGAMAGALMLGALAGSHPVVGAPLGDPGWSTTISYAGDRNMRRGDSDADGDLKRAGIVTRRGPWVLGAESSMDTPQRAPSGEQRDTGLAGLTLGFEPSPEAGTRARSGAYLSAAQVNGAASTLMYQAIDAAHAWSGMGDSRKSPPSGASGLELGVSAYHERSATLVDGASAALHAQAAVHGTLGSSERSGGAQAVLSFGAPNAVVSPRLASIPPRPSSGAAVYGGLGARWVQHERRTQELGARPARAEALAGAQLDLSKRASVRVEYRRPLLTEVSGAERAPVPELELSFSLRF